MPVIKWKVVPEVPTEGMLEAAALYRQECEGLNRPIQSSKLYAVMLAAAPKRTDAHSGRAEP
jgi:hypothetical protein